LLVYGTFVKTCSFSEVRFALILHPRDPTYQLLLKKLQFLYFIGMRDFLVNFWGPFGGPKTFFLFYSSFIPHVLPFPIQRKCPSALAFSPPTNSPCQPIPSAPLLLSTLAALGLVVDVGLHLKRTKQCRRDGRIPMAAPCDWSIAMATRVLGRLPSHSSTQSGWMACPF